MPQEYSPAPEVEEIARDLIYSDHTHLASVRVEYIFASEEIKQNGKVVWGRAKKVTGLNAWLASEFERRDAKEAEEFFVIEIVRPIWLQLTEKEKKALVDHELTHCEVDLDTSRLSIRPHDLEEFTSIVQKHGLWRSDVEVFVEAAKQKPLFDRGYDKVTMIVGEKEVDITDHLEASRL